MGNVATAIAEGKTKIIHSMVEDPNKVIVQSKDDITAGDGELHDVIPGKGALSNKITCNVFDFLKACGVPVAFESKLDDTRFVAPKCVMIPLEVVVRRRAAGSYIERYPNVRRLDVFEPLGFELFLKTSGKKWKEQSLPVDDPFIQVRGGEMNLHHPHKPFGKHKPFLTIPTTDVFHDSVVNPIDILSSVERHATRAFKALEKAYAMAAGFVLVDFKVEFGFDSEDRLLLADVIDAEQARLVRGGKHYDKQPYREDGASAIPVLMERWGDVLAATERFSTL